MATSNCLVTNIRQNIVFFFLCVCVCVCVCVCSAEETHTGLEQHEDE